MAWRRPGDKPLSELMMVSLLTHICATRPQWVNSVIVACTNSWPGWIITIKIKIKVKVQPAMAQPMAWHQSGDEPLSELMMAEFTDHLSHSASTSSRGIPWWRHQMEIFSALPAIFAGNSPVPGEFPAQRPVTRSFDVFFDLRLNKQLSKQSWGWWLDTLSRPLWRHCNAENQVANKETWWQLSTQCISPKRGTRITSWQNVPSQ